MSAGAHDSTPAFDASLPLERAHTIPAAWYFDAAIYSAEGRTVFGATWQAVGRCDQVAEPGRYFTADVAGTPVLIVRGDDGVLRAFANVCRHRAARVAPEAEGKASRLRCRYHGWTYDLCGRLRGTPEFDGVADFPREENGLPHFAVAEWGTVRFRPSRQDTRIARRVSEAAAGEQVEPLGLGSLRFVARREYQLACNWKVFVDNYLDGGYHVNTVHPGLAEVLDYAQYRTQVAGNTALQSSPLTASGSATLDTVRTGERAYYWWVFPNFMLNAYAGVMDTNLVLPLGPNACRVVFDFYFADAQGAEAESRIAKSIAVAEQIQQEDIGICEEVQRGLASHWFETGRFSVRREIAAYHFHRLLAERLG